MPHHSLLGFEKVVIWGHKLHTHTHSYIHNAFFIAFKHMGYETYWFDDNDNVKSFDFSQSLFITEGQVDKKIPIRNDCQYILHNCESPKYKKLDPRNWINLQVYTDQILNFPDLVKVDTCIYYDFPGRCVYIPWATDLLPFEIDEIKKNLPLATIQNYVYWVGTIGDGKFGNIHQINPFIDACKENGIDFIQKTGISVEANKSLISSSYMAPTIVGEWQLNVGYVPCRIFKNISYGKMGITNSPRVYELFEGKIVYNQNTYQLFYDAKERLKNLQIEEIYELMDLVKNKHTYINRINTLLDFLDLVHKAHHD